MSKASAHGGYVPHMMDTATQMNKSAMDSRGNQTTATPRGEENFKLQQHQPYGITIAPHARVVVLGTRRQ